MTHIKDPTRLSEWRVRLLFLFLVALLTALPCQAIDWQLRLSTNNDLLVSNTVEDDFYTFGGGLAPRSWLGDWSLWLEAGAVHLGEGVLGQSLQNDVHELIGDDPDHESLRYGARSRDPRLPHRSRTESAPTGTVDPDQRCALDAARR